MLATSICRPPQGENRFLCCNTGDAGGVDHCSVPVRATSTFSVRKFACVIKALVKLGVARFSQQRQRQLRHVGLKFAISKFVWTRSLMPSNCFEHFRSKTATLILITKKHMSPPHLATSVPESSQVLNLWLDSHITNVNPFEHAAEKFPRPSADYKHLFIWT